MAKRYARLNWQNKPSVATPINATNLNKMDKGIDDIDTALNNLENSIVGQIVNDPTKINNAAVNYSLANQISELNKNSVANDVLNKIVPLAGITFSSASYAKRIGNKVEIYLNITGYTITENTSLQIAELDISIRPAPPFIAGFGIATNSNAMDNVLVRGTIFSDGKLYVSMPKAQPYCNVWFEYYI